MAITFPYSGSAHNSATLSFTTSSDVVSGDVIWCIIGINLTGNTITPPSGFTELTLSGGNNTAGNLAQIRIYYNLSPAASTTYNATHGGSGRSDLAWVQVRGSDNSSIANHVNTSVGGAKAAAESQTSSNITTTNATTTLLGFIGFRAFPVNGIASGASFTEIVDSVGADGSTNIHQELAYRDVTSTGTYAYAATLNPADGEPVIIGTIALNPAGGGTQNVTASGINSGQALGAPNVEPVISSNGVTSSERLGAAQVSTTYTITAYGIVSAERAGTATVTPGSVTVSASGVGSGEKLGTPTIQNIIQITPSGITTSERLGNSTVSSTYTINANGIASAERSGSTAVNSVVSGNGVTSSEAVGSPNINLTVNSAGIRTCERMGSPTVTPGAVTINAAGIASSEASGTSTVILAQSIAAAGIATASAVGLATITVGPVTINASGIVSSEGLGSAQLNLSITAAGIPSTEGFGSPTITVTAAGISAGNISSSERIGSPTITTTVTVNANGIRSEERSGATTLYRQVLSGGVGSCERLGNPTITVGPATINASGILSSGSLGTPIINAIPLVPPTPNTLIKLRIGQTVLSNNTGQSTLRMEDSETLISI